jgi:hypothetical protein
MRFWNRLRLRARMGRVETELTDEIRLHREMLEEEFVRDGMSRGDAARAAARQFGNASAAADLSREEWSFPRFDAIWKDLGFALRLMWRQPLVTAAAVLTVAFGVGANTAVLSVLETVLLNPLGMSHTADVTVARVHIDKLRMRDAPDSGVEFADIHAMRDAFSAVAAVEGRAWTYQTGSQVTRLLGRAVTPEFFEVFGVSPALGRFLNEDDRNSVVLSHEMWQSQFGGDAGVLGRTVMLDDTPHRIVGVTPKNFRFPPDASAWSPLILSPERLAKRGYNMNLLVFARLRAGISTVQASGRINRYVAGIEAAPGGKDLADVGYGIDLDPFAVYLAGDLRGPLWLLSVAALVVLLTGCANVAGLLLTRSAGRRKEIAIRFAMGATSWQIVRQLLLESVVLGALGGLAGLGVAKVAILFVTRVPIPGKQVLALVSLDGKVLLYGLAMACVSVEEGGPAGAGEAARNDGQSSALQADTGPDWRAESASERMGKLLFHWVPLQRLLRDRAPCSGTSDPTFATAQPAAVPASRRGVMVAAPGEAGADPSVGTCACLRRELSGEPDAGNLHLRFDEGRVGRAVRVALLSYSTGSVRLLKARRRSDRPPAPAFHHRVSVAYEAFWM